MLKNLSPLPQNSLWNFQHNLSFLTHSSSYSLYDMVSRSFTILSLNIFQFSVNFSLKKWCLGLNSALSVWPAANEVGLIISLIGRYIAINGVYDRVKGSAADPCSWVALALKPKIFFTFTTKSVLHYSPHRNWFFESKRMTHFSFILLNFNCFVPTNLSSL